MPTCQNCREKWKWKQTFTRMVTMDTGMKCPYCHEKQYIKTKTKKRNKLSLIQFVDKRGLEWFHSEPLLHFSDQIGLREQAGLVLPFQDGFRKYSLSLQNSISIYK